VRNWYLHLQKGFLGCGFIQSKINPCLFICNDCLIVVYTDNCLIFANNDERISNFCKCLSTKFLLKDEGNIKTFFISTSLIESNPMVP
jgi:hypothetical protein